MKLTVTGRQIDITDAHRNAIHKKVSRLGRVLGSAALSAQAIVARERALTICDLTVRARGDHVLHARARGKRFHEALAAASDRVYRQAKTLADRWKSRRKGAAA